MGFIILRYLAPVVLMIGYVVYQLAIKRKKWHMVQGDAMACFVFALVWVAIAYFISN